MDGATSGAVGERAQASTHFHTGPPEPGPTMAASMLSAVFPANGCPSPGPQREARGQTGDFDVCDTEARGVPSIWDELREQASPTDTEIPAGIVE